MREHSGSMVTYTIRQRGFLGRAYVVSGDQGDVLVGFRGFRGHAHFTLDGRTYVVRNRGWRGRLVLEQKSGGREIATIEPAGILSSRQIVRLPDRRLEVASRGFWRRTWDVRQGDRVVGTIRATGLFRVALVAELPGKLEPQFRILLILLVVVLRRRAAAAAAAS